MFISKGYANFNTGTFPVYFVETGRRNFVVVELENQRGETVVQREDAREYRGQDCEWQEVEISEELGSRIMSLKNAKVGTQA